MSASELKPGDRIRGRNAGGNGVVLAVHETSVWVEWDVVDDDDEATTIEPYVEVIPIPADPPQPEVVKVAVTVRRDGKFAYALSEKEPDFNPASETWLLQSCTPRTEILIDPATGRVVQDEQVDVDEIKNYIREALHPQAGEGREHQIKRLTAAIRAIDALLPPARDDHIVDANKKVADPHPNAVGPVVQRDDEPAAFSWCDDTAQMSKLLRRVVENGMIIASTNDLSELEIAHASANGRMYVDENGYGFAAVPKPVSDDTAARIEQLRGRRMHLRPIPGGWYLHWNDGRRVSQRNTFASFDAALDDALAAAEQEGGTP